MPNRTQLTPPAPDLEARTERARLQPCRTSDPEHAALAAEVSLATPDAPTATPASTKLRSLPKLTLQLCVILFAALTMLGAGSPATRFDHLGHKLMCPCGCAEILLECNHVGCPDSAGMIAELHNQLATTLPDHDILNWFAAKYGPTVLAAPLRGGFDLVAWIVPFAVLALGIAGVTFLLRRWKRHQLASALPQPPPTDPTLRERIRRETTFEP